MISRARKRPARHRAGREFQVSTPVAISPGLRDLEGVLVATGVDPLSQPAGRMPASVPHVAGIVGIAVPDLIGLTAPARLPLRCEQREQIYVQLLGLRQDPLLELFDCRASERGKPGVELPALAEEAGVVARRVERFDMRDIHDAVLSGK